MSDVFNEKYQLSHAGMGLFLRHYFTSKDFVKVESQNILTFGLSLFEYTERYIGI